MIIPALILVFFFPVLSFGGEAGPDPEPTGPLTYVDRAYRFQIEHPSDFEIRKRASSELGELTPAPLAGIFLMNPRMAAGQLAGIEPADLEIRVYAADGYESLETWLEQYDFAFGTTGAQVSTYGIGAVQGLKVCQSTMLAPGCSIYVLGKHLVYQLTPATREGEQIMSSFTLAPAS